MRRLSWIPVVIGVLLVAGVVAGRDAIGQSVGPTCALQVHGTNATMTVRGWSAPETCNKLGSKGARSSHPGGGPAVSCSATVDGSLVAMDLRSVSTAARDRLCGFVAQAHRTGPSPLPSIDTIVEVHIQELQGQPIGRATLNLRDPSTASVADSSGIARMDFPGGLGPGVFNIAAMSPDFATDSAEFPVTRWKNLVIVTVKLGYIVPSGTVVRRRPNNLWDIMVVGQTSQSFSGHGTEISFDCAANLWNVLPVFVGRVQGKDAVRFKDFEVPIIRNRTLPPDWVLNGQEPDPHAAVPNDTCL